MGCTSSKPAKVLPPKAADLHAVTPGTEGERDAASTRPAASSAGSTSDGTPMDRKLTQGTHWAENVSPGKERRPAERAWTGGEAIVEEETEDAPHEGADGGQAECAPCDVTHSAFDFKCTFPMMVMKMETFMGMKRMEPYEEMLAKGQVFEWNPSMGGVFFLSHQWTSFSHPDPQSEQLDVAQKFLSKIAQGKIRSLFATEEEWLAFHYKEQNRFLNYPVVSEEEMAADVSSGYVWLDFASVPQAAAAEEARLRAIDSIPFYVDNALCFLAIVPRVEHKDLPGTFCTYKSWMERGWCRLETQVHELRLFKELPGEMMPGVPKFDLPRRPLIVHSADYATTYDLMDNFYMLWQRKTSVFTGEFACCRLGHKRKDKSGELLSVTCDKTRIRPLVRSLWERKIAHLRNMPPFLRFMFHWRWTSHTDLMMSDFVEDTQQSCDPNVRTLDDMINKYRLDEPLYQTMGAMMPMFMPMFLSHPSFSEPDDTPITGGGGTVFKPQMEAWFAKWAEKTATLADFQLAWAMCYAVAEGNLEMVKHLHQVEGADLSLGYSWGITFVDFAAGKGHTRIIKYLAEHGGIEVLNKPSFRERITAIDRACKAGFVDVLDLLVSLGANLFTVRQNRQTPAHGAAIWGHTPVLRRLTELGAAMSQEDADGKIPLDYAVYYCHKEAAEYLRELHGGELTPYEQRRLAAAAVKLQSHQRGAQDRRRHAMEMSTLAAMKKKRKQVLSDEEANKMLRAGIIS